MRVHSGERRLWTRGTICKAIPRILACSGGMSSTRRRPVTCANSRSAHSYRAGSSPLGGPTCSSTRRTGPCCCACSRLCSHSQFTRPAGKRCSFVGAEVSAVLRPQHLAERCRQRCCHTSAAAGLPFPTMCAACAAASQAAVGLAILCGTAPSSSCRKEGPSGSAASSCARTDVCFIDSGPQRLCTMSAACRNDPKIGCV